MPGWVKAIVSGLFFILFLALSMLMYDYMISLLKMQSEIIFSAQNLILTFGLPFALYVFFGMTVELLFGEDSIFYKAIAKYNSEDDILFVFYWPYCKFPCFFCCKYLSSR